MIDASRPRPEDILYCEGKTFRVEWYYTREGRLPGFEYYSRLSEAEQDRLDHMVKYLADSPPGTLLPKTMYRIEDRQSRIFALKPGAHRFFNFTAEGRRLIITNAYRKHSQKMMKQDLEGLRTAANRRADYLRRIEEGSYYEED